jgi:GT2 family glycosyltransferase
MRTIAPASAVIATRNRAASLARTLHSLALQEVAPSELIVVDSSQNEATKDVVAKFSEEHSSSLPVRWIPAAVAGAAAQRNQGVTRATQPFVWFFDDDVLFEPGCAEQLWKAINADPTLGGVNAMIANQRYLSPGNISWIMFTLMNGRAEKSFAGKVIGPAINLLPEDREDLPEVVPVEWLNTTCTIYRREALPSPPFDPFFRDYSLMEDVALSLRVGERGWKLANVRTARIYHDSQPGEHKSDIASRAEMELINRHYVMARILDRKRMVDYLRLALWEIFQLAVCAIRPASRSDLGAMLRGKWRGLRLLRFGSSISPT